MAAVGSYEAKTHLPQLLERVARGERITITKHGVPVAILVPANAAQLREPQEIIDELRGFRAGRKAGRFSIRKMIELGRRF
jgi:prevent-host-death family protein